MLVVLTILQGFTAISDQAGSFTLVLGKLIPLELAAGGAVLIRTRVRDNSSLAAATSPYHLNGDIITTGVPLFHMVKQEVRLLFELE